jgi:hypothetical protein
LGQSQTESRDRQDREQITREVYCRKTGNALLRDAWNEPPCQLVREINEEEHRQQVTNHQNDQGRKGPCFASSVRDKEDKQPDDRYRQSRKSGFVNEIVILEKHSRVISKLKLFCLNVRNHPNRRPQDRKKWNG